MKGYIYKLTSPHTDMIYIGSTKLKLSTRLKDHRHDSKKNTKVTSKIMFEYGDVSIHLIRECDYYGIRQQEQIEMDKYDGILCNKYRAYISPEMKKQKVKVYNKIRVCSEKNKEREKIRMKSQYRIQWSIHYEYWRRGPGLRAISILKPLFSDI